MRWKVVLCHGHITKMQLVSSDPEAGRAELVRLVTACEARLASLFMLSTSMHAAAVLMFMLDAWPQHDALYAYVVLALTYQPVFMPQDYDALRHNTITIFMPPCYNNSIVCIALSSSSVMLVAVLIVCHHVLPLMLRYYAVSHVMLRHAYCGSAPVVQSGSMYVLSCFVM
jgi:hypothetical protein